MLMFAHVTVVKFSDRYGRNTVIAISTFGSVLDNLNVVFVSSFASRLPGNYWFLVVGSIVEGVLGGETLLETRGG
jgi:MFS family permease